MPADYFDVKYRINVLYCPNAFDQASLNSIEKVYAPHRRIAVNESDACAFACNAIDLGNRVMVNSISELREQLERIGISAHIIPLSEFIKSGGSAKCLVLPLPSVKVACEFRADDRAGEAALVAA